MTQDTPSNKLRDSKLFRVSAVSTLVAALLCLTTHLIALLGVAGAIAWLGTVEHALLFLAAGLALLTIYAVVRHRRDCPRHPE